MKIKFLLVLVFLAHLCHAQIEGTWNGEIDTQMMKLPLILKIKKGPEGYSSLLNSPKQSKNDITVDQTAFTNNELSFSIKKSMPVIKEFSKKIILKGILPRMEKSFL